MELDVSAIWEGKLFGYECCTEGGFAELIEAVVGKAGEDTTFADSAVADCNQLDLGDCILFISHVLYDRL